MKDQKLHSIIDIQLYVNNTMHALVTINTVVSTEFIKYERAARRFLLTTKDFIIDNYYAIMLTGTDDREIEKLTKHHVKSTNRTALIVAISH